MKLNWYQSLLRAPDDGGGAGASGAAAGGGAAGGGAGGNDPAGAGAGGNGAAGGNAGGTPPAAYRPDGLPDHLYGKSDKETIDNLFKAADGARKAISEFGEVPKTFADYGFVPSDAVKAHAGDLANDPVFKMVGEAALKAGIRSNQFSPFVNGVMEALVAADLVQDPYDPLKEAAKLVGPNVTDPAELNREADRRSREAIDWLRTLKARGMPEEAITIIESSMDRADAIKGIEWFRAQFGEQRPGLGGEGAGGLPSKEALAARNADPRNRPGSPKYDRSFAEETQRLYKASYPGPSARA